MAAQKIEDRIFQAAMHRAAFLRAALEQIFRGNDDDHRPTPIGDGVAVKRTGMGVRVGADIKHHPEQQNGEGDEGEGMKAKEIYRAAFGFDGEHAVCLWLMMTGNMVSLHEAARNGKGCKSKLATPSLPDFSG